MFADSIATSMSTCCLCIGQVSLPPAAQAKGTQYQPAAQAKGTQYQPAAQAKGTQYQPAAQAKGPTVINIARVRFLSFIRLGIFSNLQVQAITERC
jgi:hypothetical protein